MTENIEQVKKESIINTIIKRCEADSAFRAALRRADNPDTEYQSWEYIAQYGANLEFSDSRLAYAIIFAAVARDAKGKDGTLNLGTSLLKAYDDNRDSAPARSKLRRLLACDSVDEVCGVLRSILKLIGSKAVRISYETLLYDLKGFHSKGEQVKARWAQSFFGKVETRNEDGE